MNEEQILSAYVAMCINETNVKYAINLLVENLQCGFITVCL